MKTLSLFSIVFASLTLIAGPVGAIEQTEPYTVAIVMDTSPTGRWKQLRIAAQNVYKSCAAGDTILLYTIRGNAAHLRYSCLKQAKDYELNDLGSILKTVSSDWFIHANIAPALKATVYRKLLQHAHPEGQAMIVIVTEGSFSRWQVSELVKFASDIKSTHNWPVVMTGTIGRTNKVLLSAASAGLLHWCNLDEATDSSKLNKWMQKIRLPIAIVQEKDSKVPLPVSKETEAKDGEQDLSPGPQLPDESTHVAEQSKLPVIEDAITPQDANDGSGQAIDFVDETLTEEATEPNVTSNETSKDEEAESLAQEVKISKPIVSTVDLPVEGPGPEPAKPRIGWPVLPESFKPDSEKESAPGNLKSGNVSTSKGRAEQFSPVWPSPDMDTGLKPESFEDVKPKASGRALWSPILLVGGISLFSVIAFVMVSGWLGARKWRQNAESSLSAAEQEQQDEPKILMVQVNGRLHRIGNFHRLKNFRIGTDPQNAVRLDCDGVAPHHVRVFRRREKLFLRNLARDAVVLNGEELGRRKQCQLTLPAVLTITDGVRLYLFLEKEAPDRSVTVEEK